MIAWLRGTCHSVDEDHIVLDVQGVGYRVFVSERDLGRFQPGVITEVSIHMTVREDAMLLYGFATPQGREVFRALTSVPGVGPKGAMALLSALEPHGIAAAVQTGRLADLTQAKGIGKRLAETIVVKLRDRQALTLAGVQLAVTPSVPTIDDRARDVLSALQNLGYKQNLAESALAEAQKAQPDARFDDLLRLALSHLRRPTA